MKNDNETINNFILQSLIRIEKKMDEGFQNLWTTSNENTSQIQNLSGSISSSCPYKHSELKNDIMNSITFELDKKERKRLAWIKIVGGSGSLLILWEILKYIFHIKR